MADCSKTEVYLSELNRMCETYINSDPPHCTRCPLKRICGYHGKMKKSSFALVQRWSDSHPAPKPKTYADDFFEKFPKAAKSGKSGYPSGACKRKIYDGTMCDDYSHCEICWNEPYKESEESQ